MSRDEVAAYVDRLPGEVDVAPAKGPELTESEARVGGNAEERGILLGLRGARNRLDLLDGEDGELAGAYEWLTLDQRSGVLAQAVDALCTTQDPVDRHQALVDRSRREPAVGDESRAVRIDPCRRQALERDVAELGEKRALEEAAVSEQGRRLPLLSSSSM